MRCLGWLAWKSVNACITLDEQKKMQGDPEYAAAVTHLWTWECTPEDVEL